MAEKFIADKNIHDGHRSRMKAKLLTHGTDIFDTYELLEMLLYNVIPYKDTNPIAKRLLCAFGGLDGVFRADKESLMNVDGIGERTAEFIISAGNMQNVLVTEPNIKKSNFSTYQQIGNFFVDYYKDCHGYTVTLLLLDNSLMPISITDLFYTDCNRGSITARPFLNEAIKANASIAVVAHTHPFSAAKADEGDIAVTHLINGALASIGVKLIEHYIVSGKEFAGIMDHDVSALSGETEVEKFLKSKPRGISACSYFTDIPAYSFSGTTKGSYEVLGTSEILNPLVGEKSIDLAHKLYLKYFSLERALSASVESLADLLGSKCAFYIKLLARITARRITDDFRLGIMHTDGDIANYFKASFIGESVEKLKVMVLDSQKRVISCNTVAEGTVNFAVIAPRKILEVAIDRNAHYIIICHNHPRGNPTPSSNDISLTTSISNVLLQAKRALADHYIVAGNECYSLSQGIIY